MLYVERRNTTGVSSCIHGSVCNPTLKALIIGPPRRLDERSKNVFICCDFKGSLYMIFVSLGKALYLLRGLKASDATYLPSVGRVISMECRSKFFSPSEMISATTVFPFPRPLKFLVLEPRAFRSLQGTFLDFVTYSIHIFYKSGSTTRMTSSALVHSDYLRLPAKLLPVFCAFVCIPTYILAMQRLCCSERQPCDYMSRLFWLDKSTLLVSSNKYLILRGGDDVSRTTKSRLHLFTRG
jgi:hypothetical protein